MVGRQKDDGIAGVGNQGRVVKKTTVMNFLILMRQLIDKYQ